MNFMVGEVYLIKASVVCGINKAVRKGVRLGGGPKGGLLCPVWVKVPPQARATPPTPVTDAVTISDRNREVCTHRREAREKAGEGRERRAWVFPSSAGPG